MWQDTRSTPKNQQPFYTNDIEAEKEIKETLPFTIATHNIKYLGETPIKEVKDMFYRNFKSFKKEIKTDTRKLKDLPFSWLGRSNIINTAMLPKAIYRFNSVSTKIPTQFFTNLERK